MEEDFWIPNRVIGRNFFDDYVMENVLGQGVTSSVYKCCHIKEKSNWACKVILKEGQGRRRKVVHSEVDALLKLSHPNILADGGELFDRIVKKGHYSEKEAARVVQQILSGLEYSHSKGIVHRDIKPENILYKSEEPDSMIKLSDFGFAKDYEEDGTMKTFCGTIGYCAPEVIQKQEYGPAVDLWSLGVVLYILLCGYEPFWADGEPGVIKKIVAGDYEFESPYWDDISESAKNLVTNMLNVEPAKRPTAKQALANQWVAGLSAQDTHLQLAQTKIREFNAKRKFKATGNAIIASRKMQMLFREDSAAPK